MTGVVGIFLAVVAGLFVSGRRREAVVVVLPFLAVLGVQSWGIASGRGVSPPSTVDRFPDLVSYYLVQLLILALSLAIAFEIGTIRFGGTDRPGTRTTVALVANFAVAGLVVACFELDRPLFDPGSTARHSTEGHPPVLGIAGIGVLVATCVVLGVVLLARRRRVLGAPVV